MHFDMLPESLTVALEAALERYTGSPEQIADVHELGGGCISRATRITTLRGTRAFLKYDPHGEFESGIFAEETRSLQELHSTATVRVPAVIDVNDVSAASDATAGRPAHAAGQTHGGSASVPRWLLLEWLEPGRLTHASWEALGRSLARLHRASSAAFGWHAANFIGSLPQSNQWTSAWPDFWREQRLLPQLELAARSGLLRGSNRERVGALLAALPEVLECGADLRPALLHGDLWNGNVHGVAEGMPALIDPSSYYGHREVDLAMAELFGGFDSRFFAAYDEDWPRAPGYETRRPAYQLYYLLVHVNLFGGSYLAGTMSAVGKLGF